MNNYVEIEKEILLKLADRTPKSKELWERALKAVPGGVHANLRAVAPYPFHVVNSQGCKLYDADGNIYDDYWIGHGAMWLGHANPIIREAVMLQLEKGWLYGLTHDLQIELAERIIEMVPHADQVRFANTGTEANMYALRACRSFTGRKLVGKFEGGWHGGYDGLNIAVKPPWDAPGSKGLTEGSLEDTIILPYNDMEGVQERIKGKEDQIACIIVEPFLGTGGFIPGEPEFLNGLREITKKHGIVLIFDEVISGFRLASGGAAEYYNINPDLGVYGKALSGGFPIGAIAGRKDIMQLMNPFYPEASKKVQHGGTFCANPVSMVAGIAALDQLKDGTMFKKAEILANEVRKNLKEIIGDRASVIGIHCATAVHFTDKPPKSTVEAATPRNIKMSNFIRLAFLEKKIFFVEGMRGYTTPAHSEVELDKMFEVTKNFIKKGYFDKPL